VRGGGGGRGGGEAGRTRLVEVGGREGESLGEGKGMGEEGGVGWGGGGTWRGKWRKEVEVGGNEEWGGLTRGERREVGGGGRWKEVVS